MQASRRAALRWLAGLRSQYRRHRTAAAVQKNVTRVPRDVSSASASKSTSSASAPSLRTPQLRSSLLLFPGRPLQTECHVEHCAAGALLSAVSLAVGACGQIWLHHHHPDLIIFPAKGTFSLC